MTPPKNNWVNWHDYMPKEEANDYTFGSAALISKYAFLLAKQAMIMGEIPVDLEGERLSLARPLLMGISSNALAIVNLSKNNFGNEIYPISRCLIERIITFYYLQLCDNDEKENYIDYSKQKTYLKINRLMKINQKVFSAKQPINFNLDEFPELKKAVQKFTSKKSKKPITRWSGTSIGQKLSLIDASDDVNSTLIFISLEAIYDDGSEALHGTLYGCTFHLGAFDICKAIDSPQAMCEHFQENLNMILFLFGCLLSEINIYIANKCDLSDISDLSNPTYDQIKHTMNLSLQTK